MPSKKPTLFSGMMLFGFVSYGFLSHEYVRLKTEISNSL
ncbi:MAG: hypothetical protein ACD_75C00732G0003 [uncultured bacterium]|nr:MAG: hypothetical protein ACD_75C00732G0003 [uncultured bacterium]